MDVIEIPVFEYPTPEPPEHRLCRQRTAGEEIAVRRRIKRLTSPACQVCGERHDEP